MVWISTHAPWPVCMEAAASWQVARLAIDLQSWLATMHAGVFEVVCWPVPADAVVRDVWYDGPRQVWWAVFTHASFPVVQEGAVVPELGSALIRLVPFWAAAGHEIPVYREPVGEDLNEPKEASVL